MATPLLSGNIVSGASDCTTVFALTVSPPFLGWETYIDCECLAVLWLRGHTQKKSLVDHGTQSPFPQRFRSGSANLSTTDNDLTGKTGSGHETEAIAHGTLCCGR